MAEEIIVEEPELEVPQEDTAPESEPETTEVPDQNEEVEEDSSNEIEEIKSERGKNRVQELANKAKELESEKEALENKIAQLEPLVVKNDSKEDLLKQIEDFAPQLSGDYEADIRTVEERATQKAIKAVQKEQAKKDALVSDVMVCEEAYPELRKGSESYDERLSNEVVSFYTELKSVNPDIRLKPVVDRLMRLKGYTANKSKAEVTQNLQQQVNESATTPSNNIMSSKNPKELSLEEIEKQVGTVSAY